MLWLVVYHIVQFELKNAINVNVLSQFFHNGKFQKVQDFAALLSPKIFQPSEILFLYISEEIRNLLHNATIKSSG